jgi:serine/threonine protein kinase/Tfp pilus assembly protein PilF
MAAGRRRATSLRLVLTWGAWVYGRMQPALVKKEDEMVTLESPMAVCSTCGEPMHAGGSCLGCLLRGAMQETVSPEADIPPPLPGYGDFEIARREDGSLWELGRGAMGVTYKAVDRVLHRSVALKVIRFGTARASDARTSDALRERFLREARAAAALRHANVAGVFQFGASDPAGSWYYAMELVEGETLEARVRRTGPLAVGTTLEIARQVTAALVAAADRGLIHRDLKPGNLMLSGHDTASGGVEVKVIDFGLAKAAATSGESNLTHGGFVGTPAFASPEQFGREAVDARSDLYSLGITLWYALTGEVPFKGRTLEELRDPAAREHPPVARLAEHGVPKCVTALLCRLLAVSPAGRPASAKELLSALEACQRQLAGDRARSAARRRWAAAAAGLVLAAAGGVWWWAHERLVPALKPIPEKSLAVLPFDSFSADRDSAFFAEGVQDEVLTDLAKVADLKVTSRASVTPYKETKQRNLREIGKALDVAYVVEGSVQRAGNKIRVIAQLIDAQTDTQKWAEHYDRDLQDVFSIQSEIAQAIADQLRSNISPAEKSLMAAPPTTNLPAYELYVEARATNIWNDADGTAESSRKKKALLEEAVRLDPDFALAYCELARTYGDSDLARKAAEKALQIRPGLGEAHRELARYYVQTGDFKRGSEEALVAMRTLPNDAEAHRIVGEADVNQGRWEQALPEMKKAHELDPSDYEAAYRLSEVRLALRRYRELEQDLAKDYPVTSLDARWTQLLMAECKLASGEPAAARDFMARVPADFSPTEEFPGTRFDVALCSRDYAAAERALAATNPRWMDDMYSGKPPETFDNGMLARLRGDEARARAIFNAARQWTAPAEWDGERRERVRLAVLSCCDAALGRQEDAIREAHRALESRPLAQFPQAAKGYVSNLALVYALSGEREKAIDQLEILSKLEASISYGDLRCNPYWDGLRGEPRFQALVASMAPKP